MDEKKILKLANTQVKNLPNNFFYPYSLDLTDSSIEKLPEGLIVLGDLIIGNAPVNYLSGTSFIGGDLDASLKNNFIIENGAIVMNRVYGSRYNKISLPYKTITDKMVIGENGEVVYYQNKIVVMQREAHDGSPVDYMSVYIGYVDYDMVVYKNKWFILRPKKEPLTKYEKIIEKKKQLERLKDKYTNLKWSDKYTLKEIFPIYQDITEACAYAYDGFLEVLKNMGLDPEKPLTLRVWVDGSKNSNYKYNYLFTEWFEERIKD